jgi:hypothetical protein
MFASITSRTLTIAAVCVAAALPLSGAQAQQATEIAVTYDGQFQPTELRAPSGKPIVVKVKNNGAKAMEFESKTLKAEKVIPAKGEAVINIRAQKAGRYEFFDEFNEKARGVLIIE